MSSAGSGQDPPAKSNYEVVCGRVDDLFGRIRVRYPGALACRSGCSECCHHHLSVMPFEFQRVAAAVLALGDAERAALRLRLAAGPSDPRCVLLDDAGRCRVYEARPMICRSHGLPLVTGEPATRDVCPLNFSGVDQPPLDEVHDDCVLDLDALNRILALVDRVEHGGDGTRIPLFEGIAQLIGDLPKQAT